MSKRIRDIGLSPLLVLGVMFTFDFVDLLVFSHFIPTLSSVFGLPYSPGFGDYSVLAGLVHVAFMLALLLVPGGWADASPDEPASDEEPSEAPARPMQPREAAAYVKQPVAPGAPRREFGLRTR
jgi:hypothetical protein